MVLRVRRRIPNEGQETQTDRVPRVRASRRRHRNLIYMLKCDYYQCVSCTCIFRMRLNSLLAATASIDIRVGRAL